MWCVSSSFTPLFNNRLWTGLVQHHLYFINIAVVLQNLYPFPSPFLSLLRSSVLIISHNKWRKFDSLYLLPLHPLHPQIMNWPSSTSLLLHLHCPNLTKSSSLPLPISHRSILKISHKDWRKFDSVYPLPLYPHLQEQIVNWFSCTSPVPYLHCLVLKALQLFPG